MSAFNGEKFYGYSPVKEPLRLSTIPRNFEFKYIRPEQLDKAIKQAQLDKTFDVKPALKAHTTRARNPIRNPEFDVKEYNLRDMDVETVMSQNRRQKIRMLSDQEVDEIVQQANTIESPEPAERVCKFSKSHITRFLESISPTKPFAEVFSEHTSKTFVQTNSNPNDEQAFISLKKSVESSLQAVESLLQTREKQSKPREFFESTSLEVYTPKPRHVQIEEKPKTENLLVSEIKEPFLYKNPLGDGVTSQLSTLQSFESLHSSSPKEDLESEPEMDYKSWEKHKNSIDKQLDMSTSDFKFPKTSMSLYKSISQITLTTDDAESEQNMRVVIKQKKIFNETLPFADVEKPITTAPKAEIPIKSVNQWQPSNAKTPRSKYQRISTCSHGSVVYSARAPSTKNDAKLTARTQSVSSTNSARTAPTKPLSRLLSGRHRSDKNIEVIKSQKRELFQKMNQTHERIIELLDKIKMAILEFQLPTSIQEKNKRQKNAMEFSVRFSRNFLYPLKGMIDDLRLTSTEALNSPYSNDATSRVNAIFNLLQQALATYHKQLRFFLLNQEPQKLNSVLEMINSLTKYCLSKGFFDKNDTIVNCLLERCSNFLEFLSDFHYKPEKHALTSVRVTNPGRISNKNYELKMFMNGLNMYEPKLVPKRRFRKTVPKTKEFKTEMTPLDPPIVLQTQMLSSARKSQELVKLNYENEPTQMMSVPQSENEIESPKKPHSEGMVMKLSAALKCATKQQVAQVLTPLLLKLGVISTDTQNTENFQTAETIINAFTEEILNIVEKTNPTPILKSKKERKVVTGNKAKGLSKNTASKSTHKTTSKALKARKRTNVLRRHKTNKTIKSAISEQTPDDDDTKHINNDDTLRQHMFDGNNNNINHLFKLILNKSEEILHREVDEESSECESDADADDDDDDDDDDSETEEVECNDEYSVNADCSSVTEERTPICSEEFAQNPTEYNEEFETNEVHSDFETVSEEEQINCIEATKGTVEEVVGDGNFNNLNLDSLKPSTSSLEAELIEKNVPISSQTTEKLKKSNEKCKVRKTRLYGKRKVRDPMGPPPPAPMVSPSNSVGSVDRLELMRRELENVNSKQNPHDEAVTPTHVSMSPINNPKVATLPQMTSDAKAKVMMTLENIEVPLTEAYLDNVINDENKSMKNVIKNSPPKKGDISPKNQETETNVAAQVQAPNYQISSNKKTHVLSTHKSPYDMREWENAMKDLPQVHKDEMLKAIMEQERTLYAAFKEQDEEENCKNEDPDNISSLFKERNKFLEDCTKNRFYSNPAYEQPWKIFSNIADVITQDIVEDVENDFTQGVSRFVQDFVQLETQL